MSDIQIFLLVIGVVFALVLGAGWLLRNDPRFQPPGDT